MPRKEDYHYSHHFFTEEPHCIPGYTGYLPGFGPHKLYQFGKTYGRMTRDIMARHPVAGARLGHIMSDSTCSDFERLRRELPGTAYDSYTRYTPPLDDIRPRTVNFSKRLCERPKHREMPAYATFTNPMNYGQSVYDMSNMDPRKTYIPGCTGYWTSKYNDMGVTHAKGAHQDLCDLTSSRLERLVAERRPKVNEWYRCPILYPPSLPSEERLIFSDAISGYTGHIPCSY